MNGWGLTDPLYDDGSNGDVTPHDGVFTPLVTVATAGRHEFKVANEDWSVNYPPSGNSWLDTTAPDEVVTVTFDTNLYDDGWLPAPTSSASARKPGGWSRRRLAGLNNGDPADGPCRR